MTAAKQISATPRRRGRPRANVVMEPVSTRLPPTQHDRLIAIAEREEISVAALIRHVLVVVLGPRS